MQNAGIFFYALCLTWVVSLVLAKSGGGEGGKAPLAWHPAGWLCEGVALGRGGGKFWAGMFLCLLGGVVGSQGFLGGLVGLLALAPIPFLLVDYSRRDARVRQVKRVFFNPLHAVTSQPGRELSHGRVEESVMSLYFCIDSEAWASLSQVMGEPVRQYLEKRRVGGPIFSAEADNDFLQVYDSLGLSRFLIEPSNERVMASLAGGFGKEQGNDRGEHQRAEAGGGDERIITAGAALGVDSGDYARASKKSAPTGRARSVPLAPPDNLGEEDGEN